MDRIPEGRERPPECPLCGRAADRPGENVVCWQCRAPRPSLHGLRAPPDTPRPARPEHHPLEHAELRRSRKLDTYYTAANGDEGFRRAFRELSRQLRPHLDPHAIVDLFSDAPDLSPLAGAPGDVRRRPGEFARRWRLPTDRGRRDVVDSLVQAALDPRRRELRLRPVFTWSRGASFVGVIRPRLPAGTPDEFLYNPTEGTVWVRRYADRLAGQIKDSLIREAETIEREFKALGPWAPVGPRDSEEARRLALRLWRAAVHGWGWTKIADREHRETGKHVEPDAVRRSVTASAKELRIELPERKEGK